jgi:hypothetical protein
MDDLIEALMIFRKYGNPTYPTHCEHDIMYIVGVDLDAITDTDAQRLTELGFHRDEDGSYSSMKYGSA